MPFSLLPLLLPYTISCLPTRLSEPSTCGGQGAGPAGGGGARV
jgi:hypothetical protein